MLANTEALHDKISQLSTRVRQLEDALQQSHRLNSPQPHPLLSDELLQIKRPLERERVDSTIIKDEKPEPNDTIEAMGSLYVFTTHQRNALIAYLYRSISQGGRSTFFGQTANAWVKYSRSILGIKAHVCVHHTVFASGAITAILRSKSN